MLKMLFAIVLLLGFRDVVPQDLKLKSVLVLSRHNIRTPRDEDLSDYSPKEWPKWSEGPGLLTDKGFAMEGYMGEFFHQWLVEERLLPKDCPKEDAVYIYSNTKSRAKETAKAFTESAFKNCNIPIHSLDTDEVDPVFNFVVHNTSKEFKKLVTKEMEEILNELQLTDAFVELARIIDLKESRLCKEQRLCDFNKMKNTVVCEVGKILDVIGPLEIGNSIVDTFIMSFYDGKPQKEIAWGEITSEKQWELLTRISKANENVRFSTTTGSKDIAAPLLKYIANVLLHSNSTRKLTFLSGHDSNLNPVAKALDFQPFKLINQYEPFPIGGKIVFQKWSNDVTDFLKMEYIYPSWSQLRDGAKLNLDNPPERVVLELKGCKIDANGLCPWNDFVRILNNMF